MNRISKTLRSELISVCFVCSVFIIYITVDIGQILIRNSQLSVISIQIQQDRSLSRILHLLRNFAKALLASGKGKLECLRDECDNYDPYKNYDPDYGFKCGDCHPVNIARDWVINGFGVAKVGTALITRHVT